MTVDELEELLAELRQVRDDHQTVEVKRAAGGLPSTTWETLTAFANSIGGLYLLGVSEGNQTFEVTGVADPGAMTNALRAVCAELEPPLRPVIETVLHPSGPVVAAYIPPLARNQRPCFKRSGGHTMACRRVGDGDQVMSPTEIEEMMAQRASTDYSRRPAPSAAKLDQSATENFLEAYRRRVPRHAALPDRDLLRRTGVVLDDGKVTLAGCLLLGEQPEAFVGAADVAFRRDDDPDAPPGARARGEHFRGTIGQLFDDVSAAIYRELKTFQVERAGTLVDESDVPREAIREVLSNALVHRSFTPAMEPASIEVIVTDSEIEVKSPGGLHLGAEPATLGLPGSVAPLRNITLVNIAEMLTTPLGARLVEHQGSGIAAADRACHSAGTMPALFVDWPASLQVILLRGRLDEASASQLVAASGLPSDHNYVRLVAVAARLKQLREDGVGHPVGSTVFDARLAARALSPCSLEDAASAVRTLEDAGVFERRGAGRTPTWMISTPAMAPTPKRADATSNRIPELLAAIDAAPGGELAPHAIAEHLQLSSPNSRNRWIRRAVDQGLIEATNERLNASNQTYRLTATGRGKLNSQRRTP